METAGSLQNQSPCVLPWTTLKIDFRGGTNLCCANHEDLGNLKDFEIDEIWNGPTLRQIRRDLAGGNFASSSCRNCPYVGAWPIDQLPAEIGAPGSPLQAVVEEWEQGTVKVRTRPYELFLYFPFNCNLDCVMCMQVPERQHGDPNMLPMDERLLGKVRRWCRSNYGRLSMLGGEIFVQKRALELIDYLIDNQLDRIHLSITTNGTLLDRFWPKLERIPRLSLVFSCDAVRADIYEAIRIKGKWTDVDRNMRRMRAFTRARPGWAMSMGAVVQRLNLGHMRDIVAYCNELDITCFFGQMSGNHAMNENIFLDPGLLDDCPRWRDDFEEAIALAAACSQETAKLTRATLASVYQRLQEAAEAHAHPPGESANGPLVQLGSLLPGPLPVSRRTRMKNTIKQWLPAPALRVVRRLKQLSWC